MKNEERQPPIPERGVPGFLKWDEEKEKKFQEEQRTLRAAQHSLKNLSTFHRRIIAGQAREVSLRSTLDVLRYEQDEESVDHTERIRQLENQLAEALSEQGLFMEASTTAKEFDLQSKYSAIHNAIWRDDQEDCACEHMEAMGPGGARVRVLKHGVDALLTSIKHGREMPLVRCRCGHLNVRALPRELAEHERMRARVTQLTRGLTKHMAVSVTASGQLDHRGLKLR
jgi:hypothetical protein